MLLMIGPLCAQDVHSFRTNAGLTETLTPQPVASFVPEQSSADLVIEVDENQKFQTMDGFGAAMTEGSAWLLEKKIPTSLKDRVMTRLFSPGEGVGLSFIRLPIASTDLSLNHYSYDDVPAGQSDPQMKRFSTQHDEAYVFPAMRDALRQNPHMTVMASPWSPPAWMKTKPTMIGGKLRADRMADFSAYLVRSVQAFEHAGIPVQYLSVQNEPLNETKDYPGTYMPATQQAQLIGRFLGPDLARAHLTTKVLAYDHNWDHPEYPIQVMSDPMAAPYVAGSAMHCYGGDPSAQNKIHARFPEKGIWLTECSGGSWQTEVPLQSTAHLLIRSTRAWAKAVVLWAIVLDSEHNPHSGGCGKCRGLITLNLKSAEPKVTYNGDFYALAQASKFVSPGATRIASTSFKQNGLESVAFQNSDDSIALLVFNSGAKKTAFDIRWRGRTLTTSIPAGAFTTYSWVVSAGTKK
ncbi:MAG: glycoside hydrolase family 30 beta sandwich domain-containing protein [Bryocella sp.]